MTAQEDWLSEATRTRVKPFRNQKPRMIPIMNGGSDRSIHRAEIPGDVSCIVMHYTPERQENHYFVEIGTFLKNLGVPVPEILEFDPEQRLIWLEDLGGVDLFSMRHWTWPERRSGYEKALRAAYQLHQAGLHALEGKSVRLMPGFDQGLYRWERDYFKKQFVQRVCGITLPELEEALLEEELAELATRLCCETPCLVHRDFQSQNILIRGEKAYLIDFQGMRLGACHYDLGSLLYDPYVEFDREQRLELLEYYYHLNPEPKGSWRSFQQAFHEASIQRLMQALGAYGFLSLQKGKSQFLDHVPAGLSNLEEAVSLAGSTPHLEKLLNACQNAWKQRATS